MDHQRHFRRTGYANAGGYIVRHCHALIALWDGARAGKPSGTEEIVYCKLEGQAPTLYPHKTPLLLGAENGPVFVVHTPRAGSTPTDDPKPGHVRVLVPNAAGRPVPESELSRRVTKWGQLWSRIVESFGSQRALPPERTEWRQFHETCQSVDDFNRDIKNYGAVVGQKLAIDLPRQTVWQQADQIGPAGAMRRLLLLREAAAVLSRQINPLFEAWQLFLFVLLFLSILSFHLYAHLGGRARAATSHGSCGALSCCCWAAR